MLDTMSTDSLQPRRLLAAFPPETPRHWCGGDAFLSHLLNTYTLLVPGNEGYYIRTLKRCLPAIADPALREAMLRFMQQEGQHGVGHRRCWALLQAQGYRIDAFRRPVDGFLYRVLEPITPQPLRLSMVACVEYVNAYLGHEFLAQSLLRDAEPALRALFEWHFAEEIEHKRVAPDVLRHLSGSHGLRLLGAALVLPLFYLLMTAGTLALLHQDRALYRRATWRQAWRHLWSRDRMLPRTLAHVGAYLRRDFDPDRLDDRALAQDVIARYGADGAAWLAPALAGTARQG